MELANRTIARPLALSVFKDIKGPTDGGGHQLEHIKAQWRELQASEAERDHSGVVGGVIGQLRLWVPIGQEKVMADVAGESWGMEAMVSPTKASGGTFDPEAVQARWGHSEQ